MKEHISPFLVTSRVVTCYYQFLFDLSPFFLGGIALIRILKWSLIRGLYVLATQGLFWFCSIICAHQLWQNLNKYLRNVWWTFNPLFLHLNFQLLAHKHSRLSYSNLLFINNLFLGTPDWLSWCGLNQMCQMHFILLCVSFSKGYDQCHLTNLLNKNFFLWTSINKLCCTPPPPTPHCILNIT